MTQRLFSTTALVALAMAPQLTAQPLDEAAKMLLAKVAKYVEPGPGVRVSAKNISSLRNADLARTQHTFERALERGAPRGDATPPRVTEVKLTLSEDVRESVLIAEIVRESERHVELVRFQPEIVERSSLPTLERRLVFRQREPILDAALVGERLLILDSARVALYEKREGNWFAIATAPIEAPPVRDPRGRMVVDGASATVYLPGATCHGQVEPGLEINCTEQSENLTLGGEPFHFVTGRNTLESDAWAGFYSMARLETGNQTRFLLAERDGRTRLYDVNRKPLGLVEGLNGDWIGVCGNQILAAKLTDKGSSTSLAAYSVEERKATPVTEALEFSGALTNLWPTSDGAIAVLKNVGMGDYAAYTIHLDCSR